MLMQPLRICFVTPRAGLQVAGGAEYITLLVAQRLAMAGHRIEILTSQSLSLRWENTLPPRENIMVGGNRISILRFPCEAAEKMPHKRHRAADIYREIGPRVPMLEEELGRRFDEFDVVIVIGYLFQTTLYVARMADRVPTIAVPYLHDEPISQQWPLALAFEQFEHLILQTPEELMYLRRLFGTEPRGYTIAGSGIVEDVASKTLLGVSDAESEPYFVYVGRLDQGKSIDGLLTMYSAYYNIRKSEQPTRQIPKLKLVGKGADGYVFSYPEGVEVVGFVSEEEKFQLIRDSLCLINPSKYESLSLVLLEAWAVDTPVLVNGFCEVMSGQVARSGGGLAYNGFADFCLCLDAFINDRDAARKMGAAGHDYFEENYNWSAVADGYISAIEKAMESFPSRKVLGTDRDLMDEGNVIKLVSELRGSAERIASMHGESHLEFSISDAGSTPFGGSFAEGYFWSVNVPLDCISPKLVCDDQADASRAVVSKEFENGSLVIGNFYVKGRIEYSDKINVSLI